jgi:hypothetical protein
MLLISSTCVTVHSFQGSRLPESMSSKYAARSKKLHDSNYELDLGWYMTIKEVRYNIDREIKQVCTDLNPCVCISFLPPESSSSS